MESKQQWLKCIITDLGEFCDQNELPLTAEKIYQTYVVCQIELASKNMANFKSKDNQNLI